MSTIHVVGIDQSCNLLKEEKVLQENKGLGVLVTLVQKCGIMKHVVMMIRLYICKVSFCQVVSRFLPLI